MPIFNWNTTTDPHAGRRVSLSQQRGQSPSDAVKAAIWTLIGSNCDPPRPFNSKDILTATPAQAAPIRDVTVQTFYVVYPPNKFDAYGALRSEEIADEVMKEMVEHRLDIFEPYLRSKTGERVWDQATADDAAAGADIFRNRFNAVKGIRLIELLRCPVEQATDAWVVGRESLAVEIARLRIQGKDPRVIAQIYVAGGANVNPHTRESQRSKQAGRGDSICVIEGRAVSVFFIGSHRYDDVQVEDMPPGEWYQLWVRAPDQMPVTFTLADSTGRPIDQQQGRPPLSWQLGSQTDHGWSCTLQATSFSNVRVSQISGLPEIPPSIKVVGRVLPRTLPAPEELEQHLQAGGITCQAAAHLNGSVYLYQATHDGETYIVDLTGNHGLAASPSHQAGTNVFRLVEKATVTIDGVNYSWRTDGLPPEIVGRLSFTSQNDCPSEAMPVDEGGINKWVLGRRHSSEAFMHGTPVFIQNADQYLGRGGNLVIGYSERDSQGRPTFKLTLLSGSELPLFVRPYKSGQWVKVVWPWPAATATQFEVPGVELIGVSNKLIFGTSYYDIATSHTL